MSARTSIVGVGYVGPGPGVCGASVGHDVVIRDIHAARIDTLNAGRIPSAVAGARGRN